MLLDGSIFKGTLSAAVFVGSAQKLTFTLRKGQEEQVPVAQSPSVKTISTPWALGASPGPGFITTQLNF